MTGTVIRPHKVLSPLQMLETLDTIKDVQAEIICHIQAWLNEPRPEVDDRFIAARKQEAMLLETVMVFDRRNWRQTNPANDAEVKAEAVRQQRLRRRREVSARYRQRDDQPEGESL